MIDSFDTAKTLLTSDSQISTTQSFQLAKLCADRIASKSDENQAREIVIRVLDKFHRIPVDTKEMWLNIVAAVGLYPYLKQPSDGLRETLLFEAHRSFGNTEVILHKEQREIIDRILDGDSVVLAAPTSFGKSLLIDEVIASNQYRNMVVVQPTLALLDETRKRLSAYEDYNLVVSTRQLPIDGPNIFLFTGERVVEYQLFPKIDFFVIDEFYKLSLSRDDDRSIILNQALYKLLAHTDKFYMLGPTIGSISEHLERRTKARLFKTDFSTVAVDIETVGAPSRLRGRQLEREEELYELLDRLDEPTIVYCSSPDKAERLAAGYAQTFELSSTEKLDRPDLDDTTDWIKENVHDRWALVPTLHKGIAFHHGNVPRHLGSAIVSLFNAKAVRVLFCTSTLIEGVNTSAKNVVLYDNKKGKKPIDYFDYRNIAGRSGRMNRYFLGRVYQFQQTPSQSELNIDVPLFDQKTAPIDLLLQLKPEDLEKESKQRIDDFIEHRPTELIELIRQSPGVPAEGQLTFYDEIIKELPRRQHLLRWTGWPTYQELQAVLQLCWNHFFRGAESFDGIASANQLALLAREYGRLKSIKRLINNQLETSWTIQKYPDEAQRIQITVQRMLTISRRWFDFRLAKWLVTASRLQSYACKKHNLTPGNYEYFSTALENSFANGVFAILLEYDIPPSAAHKLQERMELPKSWNELVKILRRGDLKEFGLSRYEQRKIREVVRTEP